MAAVSEAAIDDATRPEVLPSPPAVSDTEPLEVISQSVISQVSHGGGESPEMVSLPRTLQELFAPRRSRALSLLRPDPIVVLNTSKDDMGNNLVEQQMHDSEWRWTTEKIKKRWRPAGRGDLFGRVTMYGVDIVEWFVILDRKPFATHARPHWDAAQFPGKEVLIIGPKFGETPLCVVQNKYHPVDEKKQPIESRRIIREGLLKTNYVPQGGVQAKNLWAHQLTHYEPDPARWRVGPPNRLDKNTRDRASPWKSQQIFHACLEWLTGAPWEQNVRERWNRNEEDTANLEVDCLSRALASAGEYNGEQHYSPAPYYHGDRAEAELVAQQRRDACTAENCEKAGLRLFVVRYDEANAHTPLEDWFALVRPMAEEALARRGLPHAALRA